MNTMYLDQRVMEYGRTTPNAPAVGTSSGWLTYSQLADRVQQLAIRLQARGIGPGSFVLNLLPNGAASVAAGLAIQRTGACLVEVNREWGAEFISTIVQTTKTCFAFALPSDALKVPGVERLDLLTSWDSSSGLAMFHGAGARSPEDLALLLFTSASTGQPRGVMLSYRNIAANTRSIVRYLELRARDRVMSILPLSYSYGRSLLQTHLWVGGSIFFDHRFMYPRLVLEAMAKEGCTGFAGVPLTFEVLRRKCDPRAIRMPALRYVTQAGGAMSAEVRLWARDAFAPALFYVMYGQTEATARLAYLPPERLHDKPDAVGVPIPGVELKVIGDDGREAPAGVVGNLIARGENVTRGYFDAPDETERILKGGWLWTGDLARCDAEGYFYVVGRKRAMLKVSGHRFSPEEVEARLSQHPAVKEACVVGVPDSITGEAAWAFVVLDTPVDHDALRRMCAATLPSFKTPARVIAVDALPRSAAGKIRRTELEERARGLAQVVPQCS